MPDRPAFRAGHPQVFLADISQFQPDISDTAYLAWSPAIIIRAMYGARTDDTAWYGGARRAALHAAGARFLGIYQYITPGTDPAAQARALIRLLGPLQPGELPIADLETGGAGQEPRWQAWQQVIRAEYGITPWLYSGLDFAAAQHLHPQWIAAYQPSPPPVPHLLWQFTDTYDIPGVGVADCSVYNGTITTLAALAWQPPDKEADDDMPAGVIRSAPGIRESHTWREGTAGQIVLYSDWQGAQDSPPVVELRIGRLDAPPSGGVSITVDGTFSYDIPSPGGCNGCSLQRTDDGPATVAWHTNAP